MGKIINLMAAKPRVVWFIDIGEKEYFSCEYREEGMTRICREAHWSVVVEAATVDRLCIMLKNAEADLAKQIAVKAAIAGERWSK